MGVVVAGPKPFAGYGDNTNLLNWLWNLGVPSYHGGSTMVHLGRGGRLHPASSGSLRAALMDGGDLDLRPVEVHNEDELDWNDPKALGQEPSTQPAPGWIWHQPGRMVTGPRQGWQPGDPALEPGRRPVDTPSRGLRGLGSAAGDVGGDAPGRGDLPDAAELR